MRFEQAFDPFRSIQAAWKLLKRAPLTVLIGGLLLGFLDSSGGGFGANDDWISKRRDAGDVGEMWEELVPLLIVFIPLTICIGLVMFLFSSWLQVGFARAVETGLRTGKDDVGKVFDASGRFVQMVLARFLKGLIYCATALPFLALGTALFFVLREQRVEDGLLVLLFGLAILLWLPVFVYVGLGLMLVNAVVAYEDLSPTQAIARLWQLARGNRLRLVWFWLVMAIFSGIGCCACCIGGLITIPMAQVMRFEAYVALRSGDQYPQWWIGSGRFPSDAPRYDGAPSGATTPSAWGDPPAPPAAPPGVLPPEPPRV